MKILLKLNGNSWLLRPFSQTVVNKVWDYFIRQDHQFFKYISHFPFPNIPSIFKLNEPWTMAHRLETYKCQCAKVQSHICQIINYHSVVHWICCLWCLCTSHQTLRPDSWAHPIDIQAILNQTVMYFVN